jgi:hypothetical protein
MDIDVKFDISMVVPSDAGKNSNLSTRKKTTAKFGGCLCAI